MVPASMLNLSFVTVRRSCVVPFAVDEVWPVLRSFSRIAAWLPVLAGKPVQSSLLAGDSETTIGAIRCIQIGENRIVEQLVSLNDIDHIIRWKLISHPLNSNPFPASFVNCLAGQTLYPVTTGNGTMIEWTAEFYTEPNCVSTMLSVFTDWFDSGFQLMNEHFKMRRQHKLVGLPSMMSRAADAVMPPPAQMGQSSNLPYGVPVSSMASMSRAAIAMQGTQGQMPLQAAYMSTVPYVVPSAAGNVGMTFGTAHHPMRMNILADNRAMPSTPVPGVSQQMHAAQGSQSTHVSQGSDINP